MSAVRRWFKSLLPPCPACDDLISVVTELACNAVAHTASGRGGWFAVELTWHPAIVRVAVADCGGPAEPHIIHDSDSERGRGLLLVRGLAIRSGHTGDHRGRLVWADISWQHPETATTDNLPDPHEVADPYRATVRDGEAALTRRFAGVPAWFGRATLAWWALADNDKHTTAPTAHELAGRLYRLRPDSGQPAPRQATQPPPVSTGKKDLWTGSPRHPGRRHQGGGGRLPPGDPWQPSAGERRGQLVPHPAPAADEPILAPPGKS